MNDEELELILLTIISVAQKKDYPIKYRTKLINYLVGAIYPPEGAAQ